MGGREERAHWVRDQTGDASGAKVGGEQRAAVPRVRPASTPHKKTSLSGRLPRQSDYANYRREKADTDPPPVYLYSHPVHP